jgi:hypothetical protein
MWMNRGDRWVMTGMRLRPKPKPLLLAYAVVIAVIAVSFGWQMLQGICPVP